MLRPRVIPVLLLKGRGLCKTVRFKQPSYVGDPVNALRIFCEKEVDEIVVLDIDATTSGRPPDIDFIKDLASECFMPLAYGGGVRTLDQAKALFRVGVEKIVLNTAAVENPELVTQIAGYAGSSSVVVSIDARRKLFGGYEVVTRCGKQAVRIDPVAFALQAEKQGAGEIFLNSIDRDGTMQGYDLALIEMVAGATEIPVIACGGAGSLDDFKQVIRHGAMAAAAGAMFIYHGRHRAVLISYPTPAEIEKMQLV